MAIFQNSSLLNYLPAQLHRGKEIYIDYYVIKPGEKKLVQRKIKLNKVRKKCNSNEFERYCRALIKSVNEKLASGWNPFIEQEASKSYTLLFTALDTFMAAKSKEMEDNSIRSYNSFIRMLKDYVSKNLPGSNKIFCLNFDKKAALEYLNYCWMEKEISGRTFNNYIRGYHSIWSWFVEYNYAKVNVFEGISRKKQKRKNRKEITPQLRTEIKEYLQSNNENSYWLMCELCFYCLIRPVEMTRILTKNVNIDKQIIILDSDSTKNNKERISSIPGHIVPILDKQLRSGIGKYLFSRENFWMPGNIQIDSREIARRWNKLREKINIPTDVQFYSQRDSGIIFLLDSGISPEYVRSQADHYSLNMTTEYSNHFRPEGIESIKKLSI